MFALRSQCDCGGRPQKRGSSKAGPVLFVVFLCLLLALAHPGAKSGGGTAEGVRGRPATTDAIRLASAAKGKQAVAWAKTQVGDPYAWGAARWYPGSAPPGEYDCASLVQWAWAEAGVHIPLTSQTQWSGLRHVSMRHLHPGDLIFYTGAPEAAGPPGHVVMYIGGGKVIEAYATGYPVRIDDSIPPGAWGAARPS